MLSLAMIFGVRDASHFGHFAQDIHPHLVEIEQRYVQPGESFSLPGYCPSCGVGVVAVDYMFSSPPHDAKSIVWRERGVCACGMNTRMRSTLDWILSSEGLDRNSLIYCSEGKTVFYKALLDFFPLSIGSEYIPAKAGLGSIDRHGLRCESLEQLSFADNSFDLLVSMDVLEHVFDYQAALRNIYRVLKPGAAAVITVPFNFMLRETVRRAEIDADGHVNHLLPRVYHGDPISNSGALLVFDYGWDMIDYARALGFRDIEFLFIWSDAKKYFGLNYILRMKK